MIMQTAFFKAAEVIPVEDAIGYLKGQIKKLFSRKGENIVITGGLAGSDYFCRALADLSRLTVERYDLREATARGTAYLAGGLPEGWQAERMENFTSAVSGEKPATARPVTRDSPFRPDPEPHKP